MTNNWRSKRTFLSLSLSDNQTNKLQNIIIHNMNNIQVSLKADNQNGILSIQGVDLFRYRLELEQYFIHTNQLSMNISNQLLDEIANECQPLFKGIKQEDIHVK